jgi:hypothetical protein
MGHSVSVIHKCSNPAKWHPTLHTSNLHHNPPRSWTLDDGKSSTLVRLCGICHDEVHTLYNEYVRRKGVPPWDVLKTYSPYVRELVETGYSLRIPGKTPYTVSAEHPG